MKEKAANVTWHKKAQLTSREVILIEITKENRRNRNKRGKTKDPVTNCFVKCAILTRYEKKALLKKINNIVSFSVIARYHLQDYIAEYELYEPTVPSLNISYTCL